MCASGQDAKEVQRGQVPPAPLAPGLHHVVRPAGPGEQAQQEVAHARVGRQPVGVVQVTGFFFSSSGAFCHSRALGGFFFWVGGGV